MDIFIKGSVCYLYWAFNSYCLLEDGIKGLCLRNSEQPHIQNHPVYQWHFQQQGEQPPSPASCCPVRKPFMYCWMNLMEGPFGSLGLCRGGGCHNQKKPATMCPVYFMAVIGLVLGDGNSHSRRATFFGFRLFICSYLNQITTPSINVLSFGKVKVWMEACRQDSAFSLLPLFYRVSLPHGILQFYTVFLEGN